MDGIFLFHIYHPNLSNQNGTKMTNGREKITIFSILGSISMT